MTEKEVMEWLERGNKAKERENAAKEMLEYYRERAAKSVGTNYTQVNARKHKSKGAVEKILAYLHDAEKDAANSSYEVIKITNEIEKVIRSLDNPLKEKILRYRYIKNMPISSIALTLAYSPGHIKKIKREAISELAKKWIPNDTK